jgi:hypothetical protein
LLPAVGVVGAVFTTTLAVPAALVQPPDVTVTLYVPDIAVVAPARVGFCNVLVNVAGPVHEYVAPATVGVDKVIVAPAHTGDDAVTVGVAGTGFTVIVIALDVAGLPVTPGKLEVMMHVTI